MKKHLLYWFNGIGAAYEAAQIASSRGAQILELFPFSSKGHLFLQVPQEFNEHEFLDLLIAKPTHQEAFAQMTDKVLHAYLSLSNPPLAEDLLIYENQFIGDTLKISLQAERIGLDILDIRFMRDSTGHTFAMFTGTTDLCREFIQKLLPNAGKVRHIKRVSEGLREFFPKPLK